MFAEDAAVVKMAVRERGDAAAIPNDSFGGWWRGER
jgi:hypothetical protein